MGEADELRRLRERQAVLAEREDDARAARMAAGMPAQPEAAIAVRRPSAAGALGVAVALWLLLSPLVVDLRAGDAVWNPIAAGAAVGLVAAVRVAVARGARWPSWLFAPIGAWLLLSGFWLAESDQAKVSVWIAGAVVLALATEVSSS